MEVSGLHVVQDLVMTVPGRVRHRLKADACLLTPEILRKDSFHMLLYQVNIADIAHGLVIQKVSRAVKSYASTFTVSKINQA